MNALAKDDEMQEGEGTPLPTLGDRHEPYKVPPEFVDRIKRVLAGVTFMPGWTFAAVQYGAYGQDALYIEAYHTEIDSRQDRSREFPEFARRIPLRWPSYTAATDDAVKAWVRHCVHEWVIHEADEWLLHDGKHIHDPHVCHQCRIGGCRA